jgi:hypothetical protein
MLPPPGLYGGAIALGAGTLDFVDGAGETIAALEDANLGKQLAGPFLYYVPKLDVLGGSIGIGAILPIGNQCGHLFTGDSSRCTLGVGDAYIEVDWSRSFGALRRSKYPGAYPILQGLTVLAGLGVVIPTGAFSASDPTEQALSIGTNIWDFAPTVAVTYTTPPMLAEGTEVSAKLFWNQYLENSLTRYSTGDLIDIDFAITEHVGRLQIGVAGFYAFQIEDDRLFGSPVPPDGRRVEILQMGGVLNVDIPEVSTTMRIKALSTVFAANTVYSWGVVLGLVKKLD